MTDTPPDWVLIEASKRCDNATETTRFRNFVYQDNSAFRALCDMIQKYEQPPVDRKLLCVNEAYKDMEALLWDEKDFALAIRAIELWEDGFGRD